MFKKLITYSLIIVFVAGLLSSPAVAFYSFGGKINIEAQEDVNIKGSNVAANDYAEENSSIYVDAKSGIRYVGNMYNENVPKEVREALGVLATAAEVGVTVAGVGATAKALKGAKALDNVGDTAKAVKAADKANTATKVEKVKNPYGAKGKPDHQKKVVELEKKAQKENPGDDIITEKKIRVDGSNRRPDVQVVDKDTGTTKKVYEAERRPESTRNQKREAEYKCIGIECETYKVGGN